MPSTSHRLALRVTLLVLVGLGALAAWGIATRTRALAEVARQTDEMAITKVAVVKLHPGRRAAGTCIAGHGSRLPTRRSARTNGYLKSGWTSAPA
jgi:hypothetical protein